VTFSTPEIQKLLNDRFVCTYQNIEGDPTAGQSLKHSPKDPPGPCLRGNGEHNIQLLFLTTEGEIFHTLTGFLPAAELKKELEFTLDVWRQLEKTPTADRAQTVAGLHRQYLTDQGFDEREIESAKGSVATMFNPAGFQNVFSQGLSGGFDPSKMFDGLTRGRVLTDHRYAMDHALLPIGEFQPETLVGSGASFFGSTSFGSR
jgi:hypothetical protein